MKPKEYKDYLENGQLWYHHFCLNGKYNGEYKSYYLKSHPEDQTKNQEIDSKT